MEIISYICIMKYIKEELEDLILVQNLPYTEIAKKYGVSDTFIKRKAKNLGIILPVRAKFPKDWTPFNKGNSFIRPNCAYCGSKTPRPNSKYCDKNCYIKDVKLKNYNKYKEAVQTNSNIANIDGVDYCKKYILEEQKNKCDICKLDSNWQNKKLVLILDHIDGDAANNKRDNLRCVCPNCDSQLDTYKSKNKNSARIKRYKSNPDLNKNGDPTEVQTQTSTP